MTFTADLSKYAKKTKSDIGTVKRAIVINLFKEVIKKTPVDSGRAKGNWFITENAPSSRVDTETDKSGRGQIDGKKLKELQGVTANIGLDFLTNNLPYIGKLEFGGYTQGQYSTSKTTSSGYSSQAPFGMVRLTLRQFIKIANEQGWK